MARTTHENLYAVLGVPSTATQAEIQAAYKKKARELHPDVNKAPDAEDQFKRLVHAYQILKDEQKRSRYDAYGLGGVGRQRAAKRPTSKRYEPRDFGFEDIRFEDIKLDLDDLESPFDFVLRREKKRREQEREVELKIPFDQAFKGTTLNMVLDLPAGVGRTETRRFKLKIPPGAKDGDRMKLNDPPITVVLGVEPHPKFRLDGRDVSFDLDISPWEAALGATVEVETPGGTVKLRVPPGSSSGHKLRLRGKGLPPKPGKEGAAGDLYAVVRIVVPRALSDREKELFEELQRASSFDPRN